MTSPLRFFALMSGAGIVLIVALVVVGIGLGLAQKGGEWVQPEGITFFAYGADGSKTEITPGSMVAEGIALPDGSCRSPGVSVGSEIDGSSRGRGYSGSISTSSDSDCNVWVDRIEWREDR